MPSKKQRAKLKKVAKLEKKLENIKSQEQKQEEIDTINAQIKDIGFPDTDPNIQKFKVKTKNEI